MKEGGQRRDGISLIDFKSHFPSIIGSESYRCVARHKLKHLNITHDVARPERFNYGANTLFQLLHVASQQARVGILPRSLIQTCPTESCMSPGTFSLLLLFCK